VNASFGIPGKLMKDFNCSTLDNSLAGEFFNSDKDVFSGDLCDYTKKYPVLNPQVAEEVAVPVAMAILKVKSLFSDFTDCCCHFHW